MCCETLQTLRGSCKIKGLGVAIVKSARLQKARRDRAMSSKRKAKGGGDKSGQKDVAEKTAKKVADKPQREQKQAKQDTTTTSATTPKQAKTQSKTQPTQQIEPLTVFEILKWTSVVVVLLAVWWFVFGPYFVGLANFLIYGRMLCSCVRFCFSFRCFSFFL